MLCVVNNAFLNERMVFRHQGRLGQCPPGGKQYNAYKTRRYAKIKQVHRHMRFARCIFSDAWEYHLVKIQPVTEYDKNSHKRHRGIVTLRTPAHQYQYRRHEVDHQVQEEYRFKRSMGMLRIANPVFEINGFFRLVTVPYQ